MSVPIVKLPEGTFGLNPAGSGVPTYHEVYADLMSYSGVFQLQSETGSKCPELLVLKTWQIDVPSIGVLSVWTNKGGYVANFGVPNEPGTGLPSDKHGNTFTSTAGPGPGDGDGPACETTLDFFPTKSKFHISQKCDSTDGYTSYNCEYAR